MERPANQHEGRIPLLLRLGQPTGLTGDRLPTPEELEKGFTYDPIRQRTIQPIEAKGATFSWVSTGGKSDKSERRRVD